MSVIFPLELMSFTRSSEDSALCRLVAGPRPWEGPPALLVPVAEGKGECEASFARGRDL